MGIATSPARLQVNQLPALGDKLLKYAASNWTLVNQEAGGGLGVKMVRMGDGSEKRHMRPDYERSGISHVNNVHVEYANNAYSAQTLRAYIQGALYI